ncbi:hypothetical protein SAMN05444365_1082 [Micromonospora pattaloongensis]|uniref:Uncharacterized protein n=1 Tax=Micromonospora pattaloongensis TaxID=405436 RepID=A0A1H3RE79_9ACTN|nr:hypothetical protein SAMN05444365_1082 [Micromonospora pattaloongensis]
MRLRSSPGAMAGRRPRRIRTRRRPPTAGLRSSPGAMAGRRPTHRPPPSWPAQCCDPRPARWPGAGRRRCWSLTSLHGCDPRPARWPGAGSSRCHRRRRPTGRCDPRPARWPGAGSCSSASLSITNSLRSSPGAMAGRRLPPVHRQGDDVGVAILARRDGRAQGRIQRWRSGHPGVAILARRDGRAQAAAGPPVQGVRGRVAILARRDGRAQGWRRSCRAGWDRPRCDPRPARWPGAGGAARRRLALAVDVAILARRDGRAQGHSGRTRHADQDRGCDPRPARWPGAGTNAMSHPVAGREVAILARRDGRAQVPQ